VTWCKYKSSDTTSKQLRLRKHAKMSMPITQRPHKIHAGSQRTRDNIDGTLSFKGRQPTGSGQPTYISPAGSGITRTTCGRGRIRFKRLLRRRVQGTCTVYGMLRRNTPGWAHGTCPRHEWPSCLAQRFERLRLSSEELRPARALQCLRQQSALSWDELGLRILHPLRSYLSSVPWKNLKEVQTPLGVQFYAEERRPWTSMRPWTCNTSWVRLRRQHPALAHGDAFQKDEFHYMGREHECEGLP
jgi:hypothetical protein